MQTIDKEDATKYESGRNMESLLTVEPGESFAIETWGAFEGTLFDHGLGEFSADDVPRVFRIESDESIIHVNAVIMDTLEARTDITRRILNYGTRDQDR